MITIIFFRSIPNSSATTWANTVRCPCPCGTEDTLTVTDPDGSNATVADAKAPFLAPAFSLSSGVNNVVIYPILEIEGSTIIE